MNKPQLNADIEGLIDDYSIDLSSIWPNIADKIKEHSTMNIHELDSPNKREI